MVRVLGRFRLARQAGVALLLLGLVFLLAYLPLTPATAMLRLVHWSVTADTDFVQGIHQAVDRVGVWMAPPVAGGEAGAGITAGSEVLPVEGRIDQAGVDQVLAGGVPSGVEGMAQAPVLNAPVPGAIASWFGWRTGEDGKTEYHPGLDLEAAEGETVRAAAAGVVAQVGEEATGYGRYLILDHGSGWQTLYAHSSRILVREGETVRQGEGVALAGRTGNASAPHVHLELRHQGEAVDPAPYMGLAR